MEMDAQAEAQRHELVARYPALAAVSAELDAAYALILRCFRAHGTLLVCGNGGSAADAGHIVGELAKGFLLARPLAAAQKEALQRDWSSDGAVLAEGLQQGLRAIALTAHVPLQTAITNDQGAELTFAQQLLAYGQAGDVLLGISTSGNARNVILAAKLARTMHLSVVALTGSDGGRLKALADVCIAVPEAAVHRVQELHVPVYHALCAMLEAACCQAEPGVESAGCHGR